MPKTKGGKVERRTIRIPKPLMDQVDRIVKQYPVFGNRQKFVENSIREKIDQLLPGLVAVESESKQRA